MQNRESIGVLQTCSTMGCDWIPPCGRRTLPSHSEITPGNTGIECEKRFARPPLGLFSLAPLAFSLPLTVTMPHWTVPGAATFKPFCVCFPFSMGFTTLWVLS
ncbi:hypothetical protein BX600DRAFT_20325 [Xylariales sp. PMI_506]|nr:hypothetical protein BX600DRAFT_20325 [Xylariales sp. PMI_506]